MALENNDTSPRPKSTSKIWWSNSIFFVATHVAAVVGMWCRPPSMVAYQSLALAVIVWQAACFGITIGYHRLYSHRAFRAELGVRIVLAALGATAFQGSIKWWSLRHRLHHRFTDDPVHDPYAATRGLFFSHMGWIFFKPEYERIGSIDRQDLDNDPVVRFQHKYYVPLALFFGLVVPPLLGMLWNDPLGAFIWGGLAARLAIWHCTFLVNSFAHYNGLQPYSDENTSRGNMFMALLTCGEGNHNFHHAFPQDFRSSPSRLDWDPSQWIILALHRFGFVSRLRRAREEDIRHATTWMYHKQHQSHRSPFSSSSSSDESDDWDGETWGMAQIEDHVVKNSGRCVLVIDDFVVDVSTYLGEHPGGAILLRQYAVRVESGEDFWRKGSSAFNGGINNHSRLAKAQMRKMRIARMG